MDKLQKYLMLLLVATISFSFAACSDDDDEQESKNLVGTWLGYADDDPDSYGLIYIFNADGTGTAMYDILGSRVDYFTKYIIKNDHLLIMWDDDDEFDDKGTIHIEKNSFHLNMYDEEWWTFTKQ